MTESLTELRLANRTVNLTKAERDEWARRAVKVFQGMEYSMTAYARILTGDPGVRLQMSSGTAYTDGHTIYYRPPLSLGDPSPHMGGQCDRRDAAGHLICPACSVREFALRQITHEVSHLVGGSFTEASSLEQQSAVRQGVQAAQNPAALAYLQKAMLHAPWGKHIQLVLKEMSPFLGILVFALEDARVDLKMFRSRPGTRKMYESINKRALEEGFANLDGSRISWSEKPLNAQIMIGLLCKAEGFDYSPLHEKIVHDLDDPILTDLAEQVARTNTATDIAGLAVKTLVRLWELGYCDPPEEVPPPQPPTPPQDEEQDDEQPVEQQPEDGSGSTDDSEGSGESSDEDSGSSESASSDAPGGSDSNSENELGAGDPDEPTQDSGDNDLSESERDGSVGESAGPSDGESGEAGDDLTEEKSTDPSGSDDGANDGSDDLGADDEGSVSEGSDGEESSGDLGSDSGESDEPSGSSDDSPGVDEDSGGGAGDSESDEPPLGDSEDQVHPGDEEAGDPGGDDGALEEDSSRDGESESSSELAGGSVEEPDLPDDESDGTEGTEPSPSESTPADESESVSDLQGSGAGGSDSTGDSEAEGDASDGSGDQPGESGDTEPSDSDEGDGSEGWDVPPPDAAGGAQGGNDELGEDSDGRADEPDPEDLPDAGSPDDVVDLIQDFSGHNHDDDENSGGVVGPKSDLDAAAIDKAIVQNTHFDEPSATVYGLRIFTWPEHDRRSDGWYPIYDNNNLTLRVGDKDFKGNDLWDKLRTPEEVLQPALFEMRRVFSDNRRSRYDRNLKRGKLDGRALGRRAWKADDDPRLYKKIERPGKKSYAVILAGDASSSTGDGAMVVEKQAMLAQAEMCHRMGLDFEVWFHTADEYKELHSLPNGLSPDPYEAWTQDMYRVKEWREPWNDKAREGIAWMRPVYTNLDGHNLEFLRKRLAQSQATTKVLLYYTDGQMPAANRADELETLKREVDNYKRAGIVMLGVGVGTTSPAKWGMDTVRIDNKGDVSKVIKHLERRLITL